MVMAMFTISRFFSIKVFSIIFITIGLNACAIFWGGVSEQQITVKSQDPEAWIYQNGQLIGKGGGSFMMKKGSLVTLSATKFGCKANHITIENKIDFNKKTALDAVSVFGAVADQYTGHLYKAAKEEYTLDPIC